MNTLKAEIDRFADAFSEKDLWLAIGELVKKLSGTIATPRAILIQDADEQPVGYFVAEKTISNPDMSDYATFLAVSRFRSANPPDRYLTPEEFIALLESDPK